MVRDANALANALLLGRCPKCDRFGRDPHTCPFKSEINDDPTECTCCDECAHDCAMEV